MIAGCSKGDEGHTRFIEAEGITVTTDSSRFRMAGFLVAALLVASCAADDPIADPVPDTTGGSHSSGSMT